MPDTDHFIALTNVTEWTQTRRGVEVRVDRETARFDVVLPDVLRIKISQGGVFDATPTFAVIRDEFGTPDFTVRERKKGVTLKTAALTLKIEFAPFNFDVVRPDGSVVIRSIPGKGYAFLNNGWRVRRRKTRRDIILGLGEKTQPFNHNGKRLSMWNTDILAPTTGGEVRRMDAPDPTHRPTSDRFDPYYISINLHYHLPHDRPELAAASYIDCGYRLNYDFSRGRSYDIQGEGGQLTEYVFAGPAISRILQRFTELTGRMTPPPIWALGHHQCRWHDYTQKDIRKLAETYRRKRIPCDTLWLDIDYMDGYRVFTWDRKRYPDPGGLLKQLRAEGFRTITIIDPGVKYEPGYPIFDEGCERNLFCKTESGQTYIGQVWPGRTAFPDFVKEEARQWWGRLNAEHVQSGLAGIWNDMNEPATGVVSPHPMRWDRDGADRSHERYHNQYGLLMAMGTVMGLKDAMPELRTFVLSRAGFAGIQRYAANWTGDNCATWEHLAMSIPMNCNLGLSGQPFVGSDIGGFAGATTAELLVRWYQYGVFQPFMRNHLCKGSPEHYPWSFGTCAEEHIRAAVELRYRLLPCIYTAFMQSTESGTPIQRPLVLDNQSDPRAAENSTEFLFGDHLLVAPVVTEGAEERSLYLPEGDWFVYGTDTHCRGGRTITVKAPLDHLPLFVRGGAVIPQIGVAQTTDGLFPETVELHVYVPEKDTVVYSLLHEDDGLTDAYQRGEFFRTEFELTRTGGQVVLAGRVSGNGFREFRRQAFRVVWHGIKQDDCILRNRGENFLHKLLP